MLGFVHVCRDWLLVQEGTNMLLKNNTVEYFYIAKYNISTFRYCYVKIPISSYYVIKQSRETLST